MNSKLVSNIIIRDKWGVPDWDSCCPAKFSSDVLCKIVDLPLVNFHVGSKLKIFLRGTQTKGDMDNGVQQQLVASEPESNCEFDCNKVLASI